VVHRLSQEAFEPIASSSAGSAEALVIHRHANVPETTQNIILVHGLNGQRYPTWDKFPGLLFDDYPSVDVSLYDYASGLRRWRRGASIRLEDHALHLAETIGEEDYAQTVLIGHSMGGLLCMAAVRSMIDSGLNVHSDGTPTVNRVAGVILMASPLAGSLRAVWPFNWLTADGRVLRAHSQLARSINECFTNQLVINCIQDGGISARYCVPTYAVVAMRDRWVDRYSSSVSIPANQQRHVRGSHTSIVKPSSRDDDAYRWVRLRIKDCFEHKPHCGSRGLGGSSGEGSHPRVDISTRDSVIELTLEEFDRLRKDLPEGYRFRLRGRDWGS